MICENQLKLVLLSYNLPHNGTVILSSLELSGILETDWLLKIKQSLCGLGAGVQASQNIDICMGFS